MLCVPSSSIDEPTSGMLHSTFLLLPKSVMILFSYLLMLPLFLLCQILSATWTSPSLTWNWTVFLTCPTSPPSVTQWRCSRRPTGERSRRMSLRAQRYDVTESPPHLPCQLNKWNVTAASCCSKPHAHSLTFHLCSWITSRATPDYIITHHL